MAASLGVGFQRRKWAVIGWTLIAESLKGKISIVNLRVCGQLISVTMNVQLRLF